MAAHHLKSVPEPQDPTVSEEPKARTKRGRYARMSPARAFAREELSQMVRRALDRSGTTWSMAARALDVSPSLIGQWVDETLPACPNGGELLVWSDRLPRFWRELLDELESYGADQPAAGMSQERHLRRLTRELGEVAAELDAALEDEQIDDDEAARLDRELADVIHAAESARRDLRGSR